MIDIQFFLLLGTLVWIGFNTSKTDDDRGEDSEEGEELLGKIIGWGIVIIVFGVVYWLFSSW